ncbi:MAG TPA: Asp-tRNA(Asn)/Glu-tRNA(Gln) amidotransferase subunit GatC [Candidatus Gracilibacteria bacterium]|nr:Asp-tRNA(Asn)/Glu-tRNA(Gln) amidotransferase subunit GatC [Candidatus Gracilibacteria bacterium]
MLSNEEVQHIAKLARLGLKEEETKKFAKQLNDILDYVKLLEEVDTKDVPLTSQVTGLENVSREDIVERFCEKGELLGSTELPVERDQIRVKPVITEN